MNVEKSKKKVQMYSSVLAFLYKPEMTKRSLTVQLETVIIEVSTVQTLGLRAHLW